MVPEIENPNVMIEIEGELVWFHRLAALRAGKEDGNNLCNTTRVIRTPQSKLQQHRSVLQRCVTTLVLHQLLLANQSVTLMFLAC